MAGGVCGEFVEVDGLIDGRQLGNVQERLVAALEQALSLGSALDRAELVLGRPAIDQQMKERPGPLEPLVRVVDGERVEGEHLAHCLAPGRAS